MVSKRTDIDIQLLDLKEYALPFLNDSVAPMMRKGEITDPVLKKWSDAVTQADAFIMVVPEYNAGYPGVLKNALDLLYKEWNNKPVAFVGCSGGPSGGANAISQLKQVVKELKMKPVAIELLIPFSWKAFDKQGQLVDEAQSEKTINLIIDQLVAG